MKRPWNTATVNRWFLEQEIPSNLADKEFKGVNIRHNWECQFGHSYSKSFYEIRKSWEKNKSYPCSVCHPNQNSEAQVRFAFEYLTSEKFPKVRPAWLIDNKTQARLELDGYCESLEIAFEYDGEQHSRHIGHFHTKEQFKAQQQRDSLKNELCLERKVHLIRIDANDDFLNNPELIANLIFKQAPGCLKHKTVDWTSYNSRVDFELVEEARAYAGRHKGECQTEEICDINQEISFYCPKHDREWKNTLKHSVPYSIS